MSSEETTTKTTWRLNWKAAASLVLLALAVVGSALAYRLARPARVGDAARRQIMELEEAGRPDLALRHLGRYLREEPDDVDMLFLQARLLAEPVLQDGQAADHSTLLQVGQLHDRLVRQYPNHPEIDRVRARLAELYIRLSDIYRQNYDYLGAPELAALQYRYRAAAQIAQELASRKGDDPTAHRLLGRAMEGMAVPGAREEIRAAIASFDRALVLYERDLHRGFDDPEAARKAAEEAAEVVSRLARLHRDRAGAPEKAEAALDRLVQALPEVVELRLARYRYYRELRDEPRAAAELRAALDRAPDSRAVRLTAAEHALHRGDPAAARVHLEAIPEDEDTETTLERRLIGGMIDFAENQRIQAMEQWRAGLIMVQGSNADLTWWLAFVQIRLGRIADAVPLIDQYRRLSPGTEPSPSLRLLLALLDEQFGNHKAAVDALEDLRRNRNVTGIIRDQAILALGRCYEALGQPADAERTYDLAAQVDARSASPVVAKARMLQRAGRLDEAARVLQRALEERATDDPELLLMLAGIRLAEQADRPAGRRSWGEFDRTIGLAEAAVRAAAVAEGVDPQSVDLTLMLADRDALDGRPDAADSRLEGALERWPANPRLWAARAELMAQSGRPDRAVELIERGLEAAGDGPVLRLRLARLLVAIGRGREAQDVLIRDLDRLNRDQQAELWEAVGRLRLAQADLKGADLAFRNWEGLEPGAPGPILARIDVALEAGLIADAEALLDRLSRDLIAGLSKELRTGRDAKDELPYRMANASILLRKGESAPSANARRGALETASDIVSKVLAEARMLASAHLLQGRIREAQGLPDEAITSYRQAWQYGDEQALPPLTDLLARLGRFDELEELAADPKADRSVGRLSTQALLGAGEIGRASRLLDANAEDPDAPSALPAWRARMLSLTGRLDELEGLLRREAERAAPDQPGPWIELVAAQARFGRDRATMDVTIRRALERATAVPSAALEARLRWASGDASAADAALEAALEGPIVDPELQVAAAAFYKQTGRPELAEPLLDRLTRIEAVSDAAALDLAMVLSARAAGDPRAWERAMELIGPEEGDPGRRLARAVVLARAPDPARRAEAVPLLEGLMADLPPMAPAAVEARNQLASLLIGIGQPGRAAQVTAVSASLPSPSPEAVALHARALLRANRLAEAGHELDRLELLRPGDLDAAELRADQMMKAGAGDLPALEKAVEDRLGSPGGGLFARAICLRLIGLGTPEAIDVAERVADLLAADSSGRGWVAGLVLLNQGRPEEAMRRCAESIDALDLTDDTDRVGLTNVLLMAVQAMPIADREAAVRIARPVVSTLLERRPGDPALLIAQAILHRHAGDHRAEADFYIKALERQPDDPMALYNLALVLSEGLNQPEKGLERLDLLADRVGPTAAVLGARGVILTRLGRLDEAIQALSQSVSLEPTADRHYYLARAYHKAGQDAQFREQMELARRSGLDPNAIDRWQQDELRQLLSL